MDDIAAAYRQGATQRRPTASGSYLVLNGGNTIRIRSTLPDV